MLKVLNIQQSYWKCFKNLLCKILSKYWKTIWKNPEIRKNSYEHPWQMFTSVTFCIEIKVHRTYYNFKGYRNEFGSIRKWLKYVLINTREFQAKSMLYILLNLRPSGPDYLKAKKRGLKFKASKMTKKQGR